MQHTIVNQVNQVKGRRSRQGRGGCSGVKMSGTSTYACQYNYGRANGSIGGEYRYCSRRMVDQGDR